MKDFSVLDGMKKNSAAMLETAYYKGYDKGFEDGKKLGYDLGRSESILEKQQKESSDIKSKSCDICIYQGKWDVCSKCDDALVSWHDKWEPKSCENCGWFDDGKCRYLPLQYSSGKTVCDFIKKDFKFWRPIVNEVQVGDEIVSKDGNKLVVTAMGSHTGGWCCIDKNGVTCQLTKEKIKNYEWHKTGKSFPQIVNFIDQM